MTVTSSRSAASGAPFAPQAPEPDRLVDLATRRLCPFVGVEDRAFRVAAASPDHRCTAIVPPTPLSVDKQRRLCLTPSHRDCATFVAATGGAEAGSPQGSAAAAVTTVGDVVTRWAIGRTSPVVLDQGRVGSSVPPLRIGRPSGQLALGGLLALAFAAVAAAGLSSGGPSPAGAVASETPPSSVATTLPSPSATSSAVASPTPSAIPAKPTTSPSQPPTTPKPSLGATRSYRVKTGDTLAEIAAKFGTTVTVLKELNGIADPRRIQIGQVLRIP